MEKPATAHHNKWHFLAESRFLFSLAIVSGLCAIAAVLLLIYVSFGALSFNSTSFENTMAPYLNSTNSSVSSFVTFVEQINTLTADALYLFLPLLGISGAFMLITAFYLKSKNRKTVFNGVIFSIIFSLFVFVGVLVYLPFSPGTVGFLFAYLGSLQGAGLIAAYALFLTYVVLGLLCAVFGVYHLSLTSRD